MVVKYNVNWYFQMLEIQYPHCSKVIRLMVAMSSERGRVRQIKTNTGLPCHMTYIHPWRPFQDLSLSSIIYLPYFFTINSDDCWSCSSLVNGAMSTLKKLLSVTVPSTQGGSQRNYNTLYHLNRVCSANQNR